MLFAANHVSYLDITVLGSLLDASFIAKTEVAGWPLFGWLARLQRSVFIDRRARSTAHQRDSIAARLAAGEALILFPEGTSGDGNRLLPFKSALFSVADHAGRRRGDGAAGVDRLYAARRHAARARAAAVLCVVWRDVAGAASVADAGSGHGSKSSSSSIRRPAWPCAARARCWRVIARSASRRAWPAP